VSAGTAVEPGDAMDEAATGRVVLDVPAENDQVQLARLVAAGVGSRMGFDYDEIEDLRIGVDELCVALLTGATAFGPLQLEYQPAADSLQVRGRLRCDGAPPELGRLTAQIVSAVVDDFELDRDADGRWFRLLKRRRSL
jgi:serine/threonine-protein kinase RsbW